MSDGNLCKSHRELWFMSYSDPDYLCSRSDGGETETDNQVDLDLSEVTPPESCIGCNNLDGCVDEVERYFSHLYSANSDTIPLKNVTDCIIGGKQVIFNNIPELIQTA